jgi:hypothetical protein
MLMKTFLVNLFVIVFSIATIGCGAAGEEFSLGALNGSYDIQTIATDWMEIPIPCALDIQGLKASSNCTKGEDWKLLINISIQDDLVQGNIEYRSLDWEGKVVDRKIEVIATKKQGRTVEGKFSALAGEWDVSVKEKVEIESIVVELNRTGTASILGDSATVQLSYTLGGEMHSDCAKLLHSNGNITLNECSN